jgi:DNA polymerase III subunit gamma/tau
MARAGLTAKYRPQSFNEIVGQDFIKKVLSRASQQDKPANAYLFSGTRGVGKTTTARIMAKALNCLEGPALEPCNQCSNCTQITRGVSPDVLEIDAASHTGVDNVRKLREDAVYMPMSGRYKVIIIDEAHMLSNAAFNALLKTLEEPPRHCVFIMASTAPEKFPPTVVSRCQHFVFKMVALDVLEGHLRSVLDREGIGYDQEAVRLIALRGAGSVRDSMSILGQVIAIGGDRVEPENVREVLGLAGHEVYADFFRAILDKDLVAIHRMINDILGQGLDISFFLQEFASCWRNLFLLSQSGKEAGRILNLPDEELKYWHELSGQILCPRIHAGWQMVIQEQKDILKSQEPSLALELLFFNLAYLPELLPVGEYEAPPVVRQNRAQDYSPSVLDKQKKNDPEQSEPQKSSGNNDQGPVNEETAVQETRDWPGFMEFIKNRLGPEDALIRMLGSCEGKFEENLLVLDCSQEFIFDNIRKNGRGRTINELAVEYFGPEARIEFVNNGRTDDTSIRDKALNHPAVKKVIKDFDARIVEIKKTKP